MTGGAGEGGVIVVDDDGDAGIDAVLPFQIEASGLRGRLVRLADVADAVIAAHDYPEPVARLMCETLVLANILASTLKYDGIFTLQTKGDAAVPTLVVDVTSTGHVRGFAKVVADRLAPDTPATVPGLLGQGYIAFTVDQGPQTQRYQGLVPLEGETMADCVNAYFRQSEQIDTGIKLAVDRTSAGWRGAGIMVQRLPAEDGARPAPASDAEDDWRRAMVLLESATEAEMLSEHLPANRLLYRLFHEDGVRVYRPRPLKMVCRCSRRRLIEVLASFSAEELAEYVEPDGMFQVVCEFCATEYRLSEQDLAPVRDAALQSEFPPP